jgi:RES domain
MHDDAAARAATALGSMPVIPLRWTPAVRVVPRFPPIEQLEQFDPDVQAAVLAELATVDPHIIGNLQLLSPGLPPAGPGASHIITSYTFCRPGRFNDDTFAAFYGGDCLATAIQETIHNVLRPLRDSNAPPQTLPPRLVLHVNIDASDMVDARAAAYPQIYDGDDHSESRGFGALVHDRGHDGIVYDSVRRRGGNCVAVYAASTLSNCREDRELIYRYENDRIHVTEVHFGGGP